MANKGAAGLGVKGAEFRRERVPVDHLGQFRQFMVWGRGLGDTRNIQGATVAQGEPAGAPVGVGRSAGTGGQWILLREMPITSAP